MLNVSRTASGWPSLAGIELDELSELVFEAWRLSAPPDLVAEVPHWARPVDSQIERGNLTS